MALPKSFHITVTYSEARIILANEKQTNDNKKVQSNLPLHADIDAKKVGHFIPYHYLRAVILEKKFEGIKVTQSAFFIGCTALFETP